MTYDQSLVEVWKWKEEVSESLMDLTIKERLERIKEHARTRLPLNHDEKTASQHEMKWHQGSGTEETRGI